MNMSLGEWKAGKAHYVYPWVPAGFVSRTLRTLWSQGVIPRLGCWGLLGLSYLKMVRTEGQDMPGSRESGKLIQDDWVRLVVLNGLTTLGLGKAVRFIHDVNAG